MNTFIQYIVYLSSSCLYLFVFVFLGIAASDSDFLYPLFISLSFILLFMLGGCAAGACFLAPRFSAILGGVISAYFFIFFIAVGFSEKAHGLEEFLFCLLISLPALVAIIVSVRVYRKNLGPLWKSYESRFDKLVMGSFIAVHFIVASILMFITAMGFIL